MSSEDSDLLYEKIKNCKDDAELEKLTDAITLSSNQISKIRSRIQSLEQGVGTSILENIQEIIQLLKNVKQVKEELKKSKRYYEGIESIISLLKRKYVESTDKLIKSSVAKSNIDFTLKVIEKLKGFVADVKLMKIYYEKDNKILLDTETPFKCFLNLSNFLSKELKEMKPYTEVASSKDSKLTSKSFYILKVGSFQTVNINDISVIRNDVEWFEESKSKILNLFRAKFYDAIKLQVCIVIIDYLFN